MNKKVQKFGVQIMPIGYLAASVAMYYMNAMLYSAFLMALSFICFAVIWHDKTVEVEDKTNL